jgi:hypothetical protein
MSESGSNKTQKRVRAEDADAPADDGDAPREVPTPKRAAPATFTLLVRGGSAEVDIFPDRVVARRAKRMTRVGGTITVEGAEGVVIRGSGVNVANVVGNGNVTNVTSGPLRWTGASGARYNVGRIGGIACNDTICAQSIDMSGDGIVIHGLRSPSSSDAAKKSQPPAAERTERLRAGEQLAAVEAHGAAAVTIHSGVAAPKLRLTLHGASAVDLREARLDTLRVDVHGAGSVVGHDVRADKVYANVHGAGSVSGMHADSLFTCGVGGAASITGTASPAAGVDKTVAGVGVVKITRATPQ